MNCQSHCTRLTGSLAPAACVKLLRPRRYTPPQLLKQVEAEAGRDLAGGPRFGPRPLDLDIVFYGAAGYRDEVLEVPHPRCVWQAWQGWQQRRRERKGNRRFCRPRGSGRVTGLAAAKKTLSRRGTWASI